MRTLMPITPYQKYSQHYGVTVTWNVLLVLNEPDVAVTVMVEVPEGVPLAGGCVLLPLLHEGRTRISPEASNSASSPNHRFDRLLPLPKLNRAIPGIISQKA